MDGCATGTSEIGPFYRRPEGRPRNSAPPYLQCGCVPVAGRLWGGSAVWAPTLHKFKQRPF
eukprot:11156991-Alexandrium_andersonii.AAC.2